MFPTWHGRVGYVVCALIIMIVTARLSRGGLQEALQRPIEPGFGPPCSLWQAWRLFCSLAWERALLAGVIISCGIRLWLGHWRWADLLIISAAAIAFPFQEYFIHRFLLHRSPRSWFMKGAESVAMLVHRVHHRDPWHMERAQNPPFAVIGYAVGLPIVWFPLLAQPQAMTGIAASWIVLLCYEWNHLLIHTSHVPKNWLFRRIWRNHRLHHFKNEHYWFNVSTYGIDILLNTDPNPKEIATSTSCLTLDQTVHVADERAAGCARPTGEVAQTAGHLVETG